VTTANGNITLLPNGSGITIVGDAGSTSHSLAANDDLFISGQVEVDGEAWFDTTTYHYGTGYFYHALPVMCRPSVANSAFLIRNQPSHVSFGSAIFDMSMIAEEVTVAVGEGNTPVVASSSNLAPANSIIKAVSCRVTQAPGGGATVVAVGRTNGGNTDEFIDDISTAVDTTGNSVANNDGALTHDDMWNASADTFTVTTDADVTGTDMKIRIVVWYEQIVAPTA
jgi:hypothetical protein